MKRSKAYKTAAAVLWVGLIFAFTQSPAFTSAGTGGLLAAVLGGSPESIEEANRLLRKSAHVLLFASLAVLVRMQLRDKAQSWWIAWATAAFCGLADEIHQSFVPGRGASLADVWLDAAAAAAGLALYGGVKHMRHTRRRGYW